MTRQNAFQQLFPKLYEEHPVDKKMAQRFADNALTQRIHRETAELQSALGNKQQAWIALEASLNEYWTVREEAYFNEGFSHGVAAGKAAVFHRLKKERSDKTYLALKETILSLILTSSLPTMECFCALLETAWTICTGEEYVNG